ncbi:NINE protein [Chroococcidiopsis sp.]|uniref:NINE protein n=1 Tax=Chroococcidiopsis sp. TaxID=3088168 RepID=UPI003F364A28
MVSQQKNRKIAATLAFACTVLPMPIAGLHKFYLGQPLWGLLYLLLSWTPIPRVASAIEGFWYLVQDNEEFDLNFNSELGMSAAGMTNLANFSILSKRPLTTVMPDRVSAIADAMRELDNLRQEGLISEYEFEQKRRQLLEQI